MKYLVYGIMPAHSVSSAPPISPHSKGGAGWVTGLEGAPLQYITAEDLTAAGSWLPQPETTPDVSRLVAYARMIETLSRRGTILPMRYGCWLNNEAEVVELLRRKGSAFAAVLREVNGCVEMSVRVLLVQADQPVFRPASVGGNPSLFSGANKGTGAAYLAGRQAHYANHDKEKLDRERLAANLQAAFAGLALKCRSETVRAGLGMVPGDEILSLYFLIRRDNVSTFREVFRRLQATQPQQLLLTGPWPPYNFVGGDERGVNTPLYDRA